MDIQLQELIDKIKKDGINNAEEKASLIIQDAETKANEIIKVAEEKAALIQKNSKAETERMEKASVDAIKQAGRNLLISFRDGINNQLSAIINTEVNKVFDANMLKTLIPETIKTWISKEETNDLSVLLSEKDLKELETSFNSALKNELTKGLTIKVDKQLNKGFKISTKDGKAYYDFTADAISDLFASYLNPKNSQIMKAVISEGSF